jgi:sugar lactone lactonase YvrE
LKASAKILLLCIGSSITLLLVYALFWPVPIDPVAWNPPEPPSLEGIYQQNHRLASVHRLGAGAGVGPEDVALDGSDRIYAGMEDGRILRFRPDETSFEVFADTGGRPLGLRFDSGWNLVVADAYRGLLSVSPDGRVTVLSTEEGGVPFRLTDDVDIAEDGTIYFTDASFRFSDEEFLLDFLEHRPNGRLLAYEPETRITRLVLDRLYFANGVAVSPDQSFVLVVESSMARVRRYWLGAARKGESDIFIENLPGYPDGISSNGKDTFWLAVSSLRDPSLERLFPHPFLRKILLRFPYALLARVPRYGFVLGLDVEGRVVHNLQDPSTDSYHFITNVQEHRGMLYLGSAVQNSIGRLPVPPRTE